MKKITSLAAAFLVLGHGLTFPNGANPSLSLVGTAWGAFYPNTSQWTGGLSDVEMGLSANVDTFAKASVNLHYSSELKSFGHRHLHEGGAPHGPSLNVEEAKITFLSLPLGFQATGGRFLSEIGILNGTHGHDLATHGFPVIIGEFFGHEGLTIDGARLSWLSPLPFYLEVYGEGMIGWQDGMKSKAAGGLEAFFDLGERAGFKLAGLVYGEGSNTIAYQGFGGGFKFKWSPRKVFGLKSLEFQGEAILKGKEWGLYGLVTWTLSDYFRVAGMMEYGVISHYDAPDQLHESEFSPLTVNLAVMPSEFQKISLELRYPFSGFGLTAPRLSFAWTILLGPHPAHVF